jgi:hypothetical protein
MKRIISLLLFAVLIFTFCACENSNFSVDETFNSSVIEGLSYPGDLSIILNGKKLDVYTMHYYYDDEYAAVPLHAFLFSIGAEYADSPLNTYESSCYSFAGKRFVFVPNVHLFMLEDDYKAFLKQLEEDGKSLTRATARDSGLLPISKSEIYPNGDDSIERAEILVHYETLMNALIESGIDITIEYDFEALAINVTLNE